MDHPSQLSIITRVLIGVAGGGGGVEEGAMMTEAEVRQRRRARARACEYTCFEGAPCWP